MFRFPIEITAFPDVSRVIPSFPAFLNYVVPVHRLMPEQDELIDILADDATLTRYDGGFSWTDTSKTISILLEQVRFAKVRARKTS